LPRADTQRQQVRSAEAKRGGMDVSLFTYLAVRHPEAVVDLARQYRMNDEIMSIANTLIYKNRMKCASEDVANQTLDLPFDGDQGRGVPCWVSQVLQPR
jgi:DNA replication ATP-dependent helicase Dna2